MDDQYKNYIKWGGGGILGQHHSHGLKYTYRTRRSVLLDLNRVGKVRGGGIRYEPLFPVSFFLEVEKGQQELKTPRLINKTKRR